MNMAKLDGNDFAVVAAMAGGAVLLGYRMVEGFTAPLRHYKLRHVGGKKSFVGAATESRLRCGGFIEPSAQSPHPSGPFVSEYVLTESGRALFGQLDLPL